MGAFGGSVGTGFEETSDVTQCDFDLCEVGLEYGRELTEGLEQNFFVRRHYPVIFRATG